MVGVEEHLVAGGVGPEKGGHRVHHRQFDMLPSFPVARANNAAVMACEARVR